MSAIGGNRAVEGCGGGLDGSDGRHRNPTNGRRDKSTAVGRGACGWLDWSFLSAPACALLALDTKTITKTIFPAPSAGIFTGAGPR